MKPNADTLAPMLGVGTRIALLVCLALAGCHEPAGQPTKQGASPEAAQVPTVTTVKLQRHTLQRVIEQPAQIEAFFETALMARVPGAVGKLNADIGQRLKGPKYGRRGQVIVLGKVLAELSVPDLVQEHDQKKALVAQARAELAQALANVDIAQAHIDAAKALVNETEAGLDRSSAHLERWDSEYKRLVKLAAQKVIDEQTRDETKFQFQSAQASVKEVQAKVLSAKARLVESEAQYKKANADVVAARARVAVAAAEEGRLAALVDYATIRAPYDCIVTKRNVDPGTFVQPGTGGNSLALFVVASYDQVRLFVDVPEKDALLIKDGLQATIKVQSIKDRDFKGKVTRQTFSLDAKSRTLRVEIDLPNNEELLRPGMYAYASFQVELLDRPTLPLGAVVIQGENAFCWQVIAGKAVKTPILIGMRTSKVVEVFKKQMRPAQGGEPIWVDFQGDEMFIVGDLGKLAEGNTVNVKK